MRTHQAVPKSRVLTFLLGVALFLALSDYSRVNAQTTCGPRVRRSWDDLSAADKTLYHNAITAAMAGGYHALFTEVHSDLESFSEAHGTCGMIYWHRRYLLAYEDMLRSLDPKFACITIPYWDYFADYAKFLSLTCTSFQSCSTLLNDFGGSSGSAVSLLINGFVVNGYCVNGLASPYANYTTFCEKSTMSGSSCSGCIPRGSWSTKDFPSGFCYSTLTKYLSLQYGYSWFSGNIHFGLHQSIHNAAGGAMASYATTADPIFYNHHATVDLIQQLYFNCQIGRTLTNTEKMTGSYSFQSCAVTNYNYVSPTSGSTMTMYWNGVDGTRTPVESHPILKKFFQYQPKEYWRYVDATDMGNYSYTYAADTLFNLLQNEGLSCPKSHTRSLFEANFVDVPVTADAKTKAIGRSYNLFQDVYGSALSNVSTRSDALDQGEILDCLWYNDTFGVDDLTPEFRANWNLPSTMHTLCYNRVQDIKTGRKRVSVANWKDKYRFHYITMTDAQLATASELDSSVTAATSIPTTTTIAPATTTTDATTPIPTTTDPAATSSPTTTSTPADTTTDAATPIPTTTAPATTTTDTSTPVGTVVPPS